MNGIELAQEISKNLGSEQEYVVIGDYLGPTEVCCAEYLAELVSVCWPYEDFSGWTVTTDNIISDDGQHQLQLFED